MPDGKQRRPGDGSKVVGAGWEIPNRELHHWWPKAVSKFWSDQDGLAGRLSASGELVRSPPKNFGARKNAHAIKLAGPWNGTIEPIFDVADSNLPRLIKSILKAHVSRKPVGDQCGAMQTRVTPYPMTTGERHLFAEGLASLVLRSPAFRERIRLSVNQHRPAFGQPPIDDRDGLIAGNIHQWYSIVVADFCKAYIGLLYSPIKEFIFGEGCLNNVSGPTHTSNLRAVLPLTPELAVICFGGSGSVPPSDICSLEARDDEVQAINALTQVYSKDYVFFRVQKPDILAPFAQNNFLERPYHQDEVVEAIISEIRHAGRRR